MAGWTDDAQSVIHAPLPLIVFGDHTRTFKYIDFPFVRGADGTQLLRPRADIDPRFFYYACRAIDLPSRGYSRHFTTLKEKVIALPPPVEQAAIADALRLVDEAVALQQRQILLGEELKSAVMRGLFTRGLRSMPQKETALGSAPESWEIIPIGALGDIITGSTPSTKEPLNFADGDIPFITPVDIGDGGRIVRVERMITRLGLGVSRPLPAGATCFVCIGSTIGKVGLTTVSTSVTNQQINAVVPSRAFHSGYVCHLLTYWSEYVRKHASPGPVPMLSKGAFERIEIVTSLDVPEQQEIAAILDAVDCRLELSRRKKSTLEELLLSLLHKLMRGETRVTDFNLSVPDEEISMEALT